ncbi:hypothetical protein FN846DRAFT_927072, partial [Sphaerosporella brunnea]
MATTTSIPSRFIFTGQERPTSPATLPVNMSFAFDHPGSSPAPTEADGSDDEAMDLEFESVQGKFSNLDISDTEMEEEEDEEGEEGDGGDSDSDSDSNFATDSDTDSSVSDSDEEAEAEAEAEAEDEELLPPVEDEDEEMPNPYIPPHFTSPHYESWLAAQTPNIIFSARIKALIEGTMISAHSVRLWYRDFKSYTAFLDAIVDEYQLLDMDEISGFVVKERRSKTWIECGADEQTWNAVLARIRNRNADENLTGSASAVYAELKVLVGGEDELVGKIVEKGSFPAVSPDDDP